MEMNLKSRPHITCRAFHQVTPLSALVPHSLSLSFGSSQGTPPSPAGSRGALIAPDLGRRPGSVLPPGRQPRPRGQLCPRAPVPAAPTAPGEISHALGPISLSSQVPAHLPGLTRRDSGKLAAAEQTHPRPMSARGRRPAGRPAERGWSRCVCPRRAPRAARAPGSGRQRRTQAGLQGGSGPASAGAGGRRGTWA